MESRSTKAEHLSGATSLKGCETHAEFKSTNRHALPVPVEDRQASERSGKAIVAELL
jgi:hypothetical protein